MSVYVDPAVYQFGRMKMCHMLADTIEELHEMADKIGVARIYYQGPPKTDTPHYDICKSKRELAIKYGAKPVTSREIIAVRRRLRGGHRG